MKKLYRSRTDKMLAGIVGGLAEYMGVDSNLLRLFTVLAFLITGFVPIGLTYIIAWFIVPEKPYEENTE